MFEDKIAHFLDEKGILYVRQKQLEEEQKRDFGKAILTPDFLILDKVEINGQSVSWIDAKCFYGANISFDVTRMKKQMKRYIEMWGSGAIMFSHGFNEMLSMEDCMMLNARSVLKSEVLTPLDERLNAL